MAQYSFYCLDLVTSKLLALLPMTQVTFETVLNEAGSFECYLPLADPAVARSNWEAATVPGRSAIYVLRDDVVVWGGIIWTRDYDSEPGKNALEHFQAATFESYYSHIVYNTSTTWTAVDQFAIIRQILAAVGAIGYVVPMPVSGGTSGITQTYAVLASDYKWVSDIIRAIQELPNGFDFGVDVYYTPTTGPYKQFNLSNRRGLTSTVSPYVFNFPGNVVYYKWPEDGSAFADYVYEVGAGSGPTMPVGYATDPSLLAAGWPVMSAVVSRKDITDPVALNAYAAGDLALYNAPSVLPELHVRADMNPLLGTYATGDDIRICICDPRFPAGLDVFLRIKSIKVTVADDGYEDVAITCYPSPT